MTLRNVTKSFNLEDQRQEINVIAADLATFYDNDTDSVSITGELATPGFVVSDQGNVTGVGSIKLNQSSLGDAGTSPNVIIDPTGNFTSTGEIRSGGNPHEGTADGSHLNTGSGVSASYSNAASFLWRGYTTGNSTPTSSISVAGDAEFAGSGTFAGGVFTGAYDPANSATSGLSLQDSGRVIARRQTGSDVVWLGLHGSTTGSEITAAGDAEFAGDIDIAGTLDVTGAVVFDSTVTATTFTGNATTSSSLIGPLASGGDDTNAELEKKWFKVFNGITDDHYEGLVGNINTTMTWAGTIPANGKVVRVNYASGNSMSGGQITLNSTDVNPSSGQTPGAWVNLGTFGADITSITYNRGSVYSFGGLALCAIEVDGVIILDPIECNTGGTFAGDITATGGTFAGDLSVSGNYSQDLDLPVDKEINIGGIGTISIGGTNTTDFLIEPDGAVRLYYGVDDRFGTSPSGAYVVGDITFIAGGSSVSYNYLDMLNWNEAHGWGNHAIQGYLTSETDTLQTITDRNGGSSSTTGDIIVNNLTVQGNATTLTFVNTPVVSLQVDNHEIVLNSKEGKFTGDVTANDNLISNVNSTVGIEVGASIIIFDNAQGLTLGTATVDSITPASNEIRTSINFGPNVGPVSPGELTISAPGSGYNQNTGVAVTGGTGTNATFDILAVSGPYTRQLSPQTGNATPDNITNSAISAASPYFGQSDADAQIYNYLWDNYSYFDFDGDGIVSPTDGQIFLLILLGSQFNGVLLDGLDIPANATRTTETAIRNWYTTNSTVQIDRGTYVPPANSNVGPIVTFSITTAGTGYTVQNDVPVDVTSNVVGNATFNILSVDGGGGITSLEIENAGTGYTAGDVLEVAGGNNDATITVDTVSGSGSYTTQVLRFDTQEYEVYDGSISYSNNFGLFNWGKIVLDTRIKPNSFNFYGNNGYSGISSSALVNRVKPLKFVLETTVDI